MQHPLRRAVQAARDTHSKGAIVVVAIIALAGIAVATLAAPVLFGGVGAIITAGIIVKRQRQRHQQVTTRRKMRSRQLTHFTTFGSFVHVVRKTQSWTSIQQEMERIRHRIVVYERKMAARITASPTWQRCQQLINPAPMVA